MCKSVNFAEIAKEPASQINDVHALIDQFTAARHLRLGPPFLVVSEAPAVPVARPQKHQSPKRTGIDNPPGLTKSAVVARVKSYAYQDALLYGQRQQRSQFAHMTCG